MEKKSLVQIKGLRDGLLITAIEGGWEDRKQELFSMIAEKSAFFTGARVCLDVGDTTLRVKEVTHLRDKLADCQINLWAIFSQSQITINNSKSLGLETELPAKKESKKEEVKKGDDAEGAVLVSRTLRAGYRVEAQEHVIIIGDVNPGAEIVSAGNIIVWGKMKGSAMAGVDGNDKAVICALELTPNLLRIGEFVFPPRQRKGKPFPEIAYIDHQECKIENWKNEKER